MSGRPVTLDVPSLTEHIREWLLEEVQNIVTMNEEALQHVFSYMWKFNKRWSSFLNPPLPHDLEFLKVSKIKSALQLSVNPCGCLQEVVIHRKKNKKISSQSTD